MYDITFEKDQLDREDDALARNARIIETLWAYQIAIASGSDPAAMDAELMKFGEWNEIYKGEFDDDRDG